MHRCLESVVRCVLAPGLVIVMVGCTSTSNGVTLQTPLPSSTTPAPSLSSTAVTPSPTDGAISSPPQSTHSSASPSTATRSSQTTISTASSADREAADRRAIESLWDRYWTTGAKAIKSAPAQQKALMSSVAVDPALALVLQGYAKFAKNGWTDYGSVTHRPYWPAPVAGKTTAVMGDCMDDSRYGSLDIKSGDKLTVGVARDNTRVTAVKGKDGVWRVQRVEYLVKVSC